MAVLMIGATERERIKQLKQNALAQPVPLALVMKGTADHVDLLKLGDRDPELIRPPSQHMMFPGGFHAAYSVEEQPGGLYSHLSVSVEGRRKKGAMPSPQAVELIAMEFGCPFPGQVCWMEEFEPGEYAINLVSPLC